MQKQYEHMPSFRSKNEMRLDLTLSMLPLSVRGMSAYHTTVSDDISARLEWLLLVSCTYSWMTRALLANAPPAGAALSDFIELGKHHS